MTCLLSAITKLRLTMESVQHDVKELKDKLLGNDFQKFNEILRTYQIILPLKTIDEWVSFNNCLRGDEQLCNYFVSQVFFLNNYLLIIFLTI